MKAGIGFVTGRKGFGNLLKTYINNWNESGLIADKTIEIRLFVAYDLNYSKTKANDYRRISPDLLDRIDGVDYYGVSRIREESNLLVREGVLSPKEAALLFGKGYAKKRNAVLYAAVRNGMDSLLFIDDDEYPLAVQQGNGLLWSGQGILSTHLRHIGGADITHGRHCGYISPIPYFRFDDRLTEAILKKFIIAISNDIINWESIRNILMNQQGVTYADASILESFSVVEVPEVNGMKFISGANLCFNVKNIHRIGPFYNPPGARGEDTFLSTMLSDNTVLRVPCYTFHDGFLKYSHLLHGVLPRKLSPIIADKPAIISRFANAAKGWVRYKPLLLYITRRNEYDISIKEMEKTLHRVIPLFGAYFKTNEFDGILHDLKYYSANVGHHYDSFEKTKVAWKKATAWAAEHQL